MADMTLPAHLQKAQLPRLSDRATEGMGSAMPPHISIRGNEFTLVDAAGEETSIETKYLDAAIVDMSDVMCKLFYDNAWTPDSKDLPICWSANGIVLSRKPCSRRRQLASNARTTFAARQSRSSVAPRSRHVEMRSGWQ